MKRLALISVLMLIAAVSFAQNQWELIKSDTIMSDNISVKEYTKRNGDTGIKATWCGKAVTISYKDGDNILEGGQKAIILCTYKVDGREITLPKKVICVN